MPTPTKPTVIEFQDETYGYSYLVLANVNTAQAKRLIRKKNKNPAHFRVPRNAEGWFWPDVNNRLLVISLTYNNVKDTSSFGLLAHECLHATAHVMKDAEMGELSDLASQEAYCYYHGWLVSKILELAGG